MSLMTIGVAATIMAAATTATFTDMVTTGEDSFEAGTLYMSVDGQCGDREFGGTETDPGADGNEGCVLEDAFSAGPMAPGDEVSNTFDIVNEGNLDGVLTVTTNPTVTGAGNDTCTEDAFTIVTTPETITDVTLAAGTSTTYDVSVQLDEDAGNECQGASLTLNVTFSLVQATAP